MRINFGGVIRRFSNPIVLASAWANSLPAPRDIPLGLPVRGRLEAPFLSYSRRASCMKYIMKNLAVVGKQLLVTFAVFLVLIVLFGANALSVSYLCSTF